MMHLQEGLLENNSGVVSGWTETDTTNSDVDSQVLLRYRLLSTHV